MRVTASAVNLRGITKEIDMSKHINPGFECLTRIQLSVAIDAAIRSKALACSAGRSLMPPRP